ncbi:MAG: GH92 family glycosyl hydrolase, partial [Candidatus Kapabacteria bacterium]|nr:GH92 family glycosyl hydrolase [Candidatus Kapabacteria bacterium]
MIGTDGTGHTFPGATAPFGMVQLSPDTRIDGSWEGCSGYHYSDDVIYGFSHTHLNGTGVSDYGDILLMPTMGEPSLDNKIYSSKFSHDNEKASAGFYSVKLDKHNIDVRLTTSTRVGFHEYTFNESGQANIILDLKHRDILLEGKINVIDDKTIEVFRRSEAWATNQYIYTRIEFDQPMTIYPFFEERKTSGAKNEVYTDKYLEYAAIISKQVKKGEKIKVKVSLSFTGFEGAELNSSEIPHWDFEKVKKETEQLWNKELSKIEVTSNDKDKLTVFYTAMYHLMIQPNIAQDLDGKYRGRDNQIHKAEGFDYYTVFSLWDTFRAAHPLYTLIDKKRTVDFINTFLKQYEQGGRLPVWELASNETNCMIGYHSVSVMADAMAKGIKGFDYEKAFRAAQHSANLDWLGLKAYKTTGQITIDDEHESVSKTLEYAYDDWCIAQMALILGKENDYQTFMERSQYWKNTFDWNTGFMRPKKNGGWDSPFDPKEVNNNYTEGNSWQYSFFVPHDISGMIEFYGGNDAFEKKLDLMFSEKSETTGRHQVDITGLIGQYAHGNEPSHHMAYLYNYIGKPEKTKKLVHYILDEFYKNTPDGLIGNEDCGQMSAWYILSSMGLYSVTPGIPRWSTTEPYFEKIKVNFEDGTSKTITKNTPKEELEKFGFENVKPLVQKEYEKIVTVPVIEAKSKSFKYKMTIEIKSLNPDDKIYYQIFKDQYEYPVDERFFVSYEKPFEITESATIRAYVKRGIATSQTISAEFFKKDNDWSVELLSKPTDMYFAGGNDGLIDGING